MKMIRALPLLALAALMACDPKPASAPVGQAPGNAGRAGGPPAPGAQGQGGRRFAAIPVQAVTVRIGPLVAENNTAGVVMPVTQSPVASQIAGVVQRVLHQAGEWVTEGQTIVQLDDSQLALSLRTAEGALENAKINYAVGQDNASSSNPKLALQVQSAQSTLAGAQKNYDSQKALFDLGGISGSQLDSARSQLEQAQANVEAAKQALDLNEKSDTQAIAQLRLAVDQASNQLEMARFNLRSAAVKAPFAGQIAAVNVSPGMFVGQNTAVFVLVSAERQIGFNASPADAPGMPIGTTVRFTYAGKPYPIRISQAPSAPINGVVPMTAEVPKTVSLPYGSVGTVTYSLTLAQGALVPIASLNTNEDKNYVFTVVGGKAVVQNVVILDEAGVMAAVAGLGEGAQVLVNAPPGLLPGSAVQVVGAPGQGDGQGQKGAAQQGQASKGQAPQGQAPQGQTGEKPQDAAKANGGR